MNQISFLTDRGELDGSVLRDEGMAAVAANNPTWMEQAMAVLRRYCEQHEEVTGELFRGWYELAGGQPPTTHHAWGALFNPKRVGHLLEFARFQPASSPKTHAHPIRVYRSLVYRGPKR